MSAARYVGRVGGLAVAFGIGTAVLTGFGVASADTTSGGESNSSSQGSTSSTQDSAGSSQSVTAPGGAHESGDSTDAADAADAAGAADVADAAAEAADAAEAAEVAEVDADIALEDTDASGETALSDSESSESDIAPGDAAVEPSGSAAGSRASGTRFDNAAEVGPVIAAEAVVEDQSQALEWLSSPEVTAGRAPVAATPTTQTAVTVPAMLPVSVEPAAVEFAAVASPVLDLVNSALNPFAGDGPTAPPSSSPLEWAMAAGARRELGIFGDPITIDPTLTFTEGVIYGNVNASPDPATLIYTLTKGPSNGGKVFLGRTDPTDPTTTIQDGSFNYLPFLDENSPMGAFANEQFTVMVSKLSGLMTLLEKIPLVGDFVQPIVLTLQRIPIIGALLQPIIGYRTFAEFDVDAGELVPAGDPVAFTTLVTSFDGVQISTNWFPGIAVDSTAKAPTIFEGPGLGANGSINPTAIVGTLGFVPGMSLIRDVPDSPLDYNYVSWDPRGEGASGGVLQLDSPFFEGRDTQHVIDYVATLPWTQLSRDGDGNPIAGDPQMGMVGGSYGGGIQWVEAGIDKRVDVIVPAASWNSLNQSLYPTEDFKTSWALLLGLDLLQAGARINSQIYPAIVQGSLFGFINESQQAILSSSGPTVLVDAITAPALIIQGTADGLFPLNQSIINAGILAANEIPVKMIWACGGHGVCLNPGDPTAQFENIVDRTLTWLTSYLYFGGTLPTGEVFEWYDQNGVLKSSDLLPSDPAFYGAPLVTLDDGGSLFLQPLIGGSGPQTQSPTPLLVSPALAAPASIAIDVAIPGPLSTMDVVGAPKLSFTYSGLGSSRHIYAQLVDDQTNLVLGNIVTPVPVELDGRTHTVEIDLESIAYTMAPGSSLTLQLVGATSVYADFFQYGFIDVSDVRIALPTIAAGAAVGAAVGAAEELPAEEEIAVAV